MCPSCARSHAAHERFCVDCGLPLVYGDDVRLPPRSELAEKARKVRPSYTQGPLVRAAWARNQAEAELITGLLLEEGIPSLARRSGGFDVPDFLASGPRDVLVPESALEAARELLGDQPVTRTPQTRPAWMRALAVTLAVTVFVAFAASFAVPLFD